MMDDHEIKPYPVQPSCQIPGGPTLYDPHSPEGTTEPKSESKSDPEQMDIIKATQYGVIERVRKLVDEGYDVNLPDPENVTLLHWGAINNRVDIVRFVYKVEFHSTAENRNGSQFYAKMYVRQCSALNQFQIHACTFFATLLCWLLGGHIWDCVIW